MCDRPKARIPGVSIIHPSLSAKGRAIALDEVCRPRPVARFTSPVNRSALGTNAFINVDFPTPEWPTRTEIFPSSIVCKAIKSLFPDSLFNAIWRISTPSFEYSDKNAGAGPRSVLVTTNFGEIPSVNAETKKRSMSPRRGSGFVAATTITS